jgi:uncharacterized membrane protein
MANSTSNGTFIRLIRHLFQPRWRLRLVFTRRTMARIAEAVSRSEAGHDGEIRFVAEGALDFLPLVRGTTARERAVQVFSDLRVWDTEANNGVLIYLLLADRDVEIVADRGYNARVSGREWETICVEMEACFARGDYEAGVLAGIARVDALLRRHFPASGADANELPDQPALLG